MNKIIDYLAGEVRKSLSGSGEKKVTYIIGNNGTGKSRLLRAVADYFGNSTAMLPSSILCLSNSLFDKFDFRGKGKIVYLGQKTVDNAVFFASLDRVVIKAAYDILSRGDGLYEHLQSSFKWEFFVEIENNENKNIRTIKWIESRVDGRKLKKHGSVERFFSTEEFDFLSENLGKTISLDTAGTIGLSAVSKLLQLNSTAIRAVVFMNGRHVRFDELSSGEQNKLLLALKLLSKIKDGCLILIDEPEISMHLYWQKNFHEFLSSIIPSKIKCAVIIATHSPVIVSEAEKYPDTNSVVILEKTGSGALDEIEFDVPAVASKDGFGGVVLDYFNVATYKSKTIEERIAKLIIDSSDSIETRMESLRALENTDGIEEVEMTMINTARRLMAKYREDL